MHRRLLSVDAQRARNTGASFPVSLGLRAAVHGWYDSKFNLIGFPDHVRVSDGDPEKDDRGAREHLLAFADQVSLLHGLERCPCERCFFRADRAEIVPSPTEAANALQSSALQIARLQSSPEQPTARAAAAAYQTQAGALTRLTEQTQSVGPCRST